MPYRLIIALLAGALLLSAFVMEKPAPAPESVQWLTIEEALEKHQKEPRKIFIDVYTDWCGWCKKMDQATFSHPQIASYLNEKYYAVKFNAEQRENLVFLGNTFKYVEQGRRGYHEFAAALLQNKLSYPTVAFLDENLQLIQPIPGYMEPKQFDPILKYFGESHYRTTSWTDFTATYQSPIE
ncbi:MAG: thioredoxin family protein [Bernardetiaceae bacterium]